MALKSIPKGQSFSISFVLPDAYDTDNITAYYVKIGSKRYTVTLASGVFTCRLTSAQTQALTGNQSVILTIVDDLYGVLKLQIGDIHFENTAEQFSNDDENQIYDVIVNLIITEQSAVEVDSVILDAIKGDKGDTGAQGEKGDKGDPGEQTSIFQTTGTSTTGVISQNATTNELFKLKRKNAYIYPRGQGSNEFIELNTVGSVLRLSIPSELRISFDGYSWRDVSTALSVDIAIDVIVDFYILKSNTSLVAIKHRTYEPDYLSYYNNPDYYLLGTLNPFFKTSLIINTPIYKIDGVFYGANSKKVDYEENKGLSENDFTDYYKSILSNLTDDYLSANTDDYEITPNKLNLVISYGQSNSTGQQTYPGLTTVNYGGNKMMGSSVFVKTQETLNDLVAVNPAGTYDENSQILVESPVISASNKIQEIISLNSDDYTGVIIGASVGEGGKTIEELKKGTALYTSNYIAYLSNLKAQADAINSSVSCTAIIWVQGEANNRGDRGGTTNKETYKGYLNQLIDDMQSDAKSILENYQNPLFMITQIWADSLDASEATEKRKLPIPMALLEVANERDDVVMPCSLAMFYPSRGNHLDPNKQRWHGQYIAKAFEHTMINKNKFIPLQPIAIRRGSQKQIIIDYYVPHAPLKFDNNTVQAQIDYGFKVYKNSTLQDIDNLCIVGNSVVINLTNDIEITDVVDVSYGFVNYNAQQIRGGNLRDSDNYVSSLNWESHAHLIDYIPLDENGDEITGKPYPMYNFSVAFWYQIPENTLKITVDNLNISKLRNVVNNLPKKGTDVALSMDDLSDVDGTITTIADTDLLLIKTSDGVWKKITFANLKLFI